MKKISNLIKKSRTFFESLIMGFLNCADKIRRVEFLRIFKKHVSVIDNNFFQIFQIIDGSNPIQFLLKNNLSLESRENLVERFLNVLHN